MRTGITTEPGRNWCLLACRLDPYSCVPPPAVTWKRSGAANQKIRPRFRQVEQLHAIVRSTSRSMVKRTAPQSPQAVEATRLSHQIRLTSAVALAPPELGNAGVDAAIAAIDTLVRDPWDEVIGAAKIVRATLLSRTAPGEAARAMTDALTEWPVVMATAVLAMLPPVFVVVAMQKLLVRGLVVRVWYARTVRRVH